MLRLMLFIRGARVDAGTVVVEAEARGCRSIENHTGRYPAIVKIAPASGRGVPHPMMC